MQLHFTGTNELHVGRGPVVLVNVLWKLHVGRGPVLPVNVLWKLHVGRGPSVMLQ